DQGQLLPAREEEPDRDAEDGSEQEPDDGLLHRDPQVTEDESARDPFGDQGGQHRGPADEERIAPSSARRDPPEGQEGQQEAEPPEVEFSPGDFFGFAHSRRVPRPSSPSRSSRTGGRSRDGSGSR